ncbi:hypothetical protein KC317_g732, partial [Hortaea werneckii]
MVLGRGGMRSQEVKRTSQGGEWRRLLTPHRASKTTLATVAFRPTPRTGQGPAQVFGWCCSAKSNIGSMIVDCFDDSRLSTVSPHGIIAYATPERICVYDTQSRSINYVSSETKKPRSMKWLRDRGLLAIIYTDYILILSVSDPRGGLRINMGSKPFGEVSRVEQLDESKVLIIFEFGTTFKWCLKTAKGHKLRSIKTTTSGTAFATRPRDPENPNRITGMAYICKDAAEDVLCILCGGVELKRKTLPTTDAQSVSWSSDGNWIAVLDTPIASSGVGVYFYTADGNHYMSYPRAPYQWVNDLGIKELTWSPV